MKTWENALVEEISISETQHGGQQSMVFDNSWNDAAGALHVTFSNDVVVTS